MRILKNLDKESLKVKSLEELSVQLSNGYNDAIYLKSKNVGGFPAINTGDLTDLKLPFLYKCKSFIENFNPENKILCEKGDLLIIHRSWSKRFVGRAYSYLNKLDCLSDSNSYLLKHKENPYYLTFHWNSLFVQRQLNRLKDKVGSRSLYLNEIKKIVLALPPNNIQNLIGNFLYSLSLVTEKLENTLNEIRERKLERGN